LGPQRRDYASFADFADPDGNSGGWDDWARAAAYIALGQNEAALDHLGNLVRSNFRVGWWARIERDPAFSTLRATPRFQGIVSGSTGQASRERPITWDSPARH
jgi:hypothetical protein